MTKRKEKTSEISYLRNIGLLLTYKCQVACPHCIVEAGPNRKEEMTTNNSIDLIHQISNYRNNYIKMLALTGGEPFYNVDKLKRITAYGKKQDLLISVVTNAYWASTQKRAIDTLKHLREIDILAISTDKYHLKSIPFKRVKNAILAAKECNVPYNISICTEDENDSTYKKIVNNLEKITDNDTIYPVITFQTGRATQKLNTSNYQTSKNPPPSACSAAGSPIIFPNGKITACIGPIINIKKPHPLILGNIRQKSLNEILEKAEINPILHAIRIWGPKKLITLINEAGLGNYLPKKYIKNSVCNLCYYLMSNERILEFFSELSKDSYFQGKVAYARFYYLKETKMLELLNITQ